MKRSSLFKRIVLLLLLLAVLPALLVGYLQMTIVSRSLEKDFEEVKARLAERVAQNASSFISSVTSLLVTIGELDEVSRLKKEEYSVLIRRVLESHPVIAEVDIYNEKGSWIYGMERQPGAIDAAWRVLEINEYVRSEVQRLGSSRGGILRVSGHPAFELYTVVRRKADGHIVGYMRSIISLIAISENLADSKIGKSTELFILDFKDRLIATSSYKKYFKNKEAMGVADEVILRQVKNLGPYQNWRGRVELKDGRDVVLALHKLEELPWVSAVSQDRWEAFIVLIELRQKLLEIVLVVIVLVLGIALFFANRISSPVRQLIKAVREIAAGDFAANTQNLPKPNNEIGELALAFETMSTILANRTQQLMSAQGELKRFNVELEARVDARTRELKATQDELIKQERLAAIGQMASVVGHELRNPLAVINNSIYVIRNRLGMNESPNPPVDSKILKHVQSIEAELQVANQIISEILTFARTREIQLREVDLHEFLEDVASKLTVPEKIELIKTYASQPIVVKMDTDEMRQVIRNLAGNAFEAMPSGGKLTIGTCVADRNVIVSITDTGVGIAPESLAKVFTPFFTTKSKGTGLGLAVVRKVLDRHNGEVAVESQVGVGTKFTLKLPLT